MRKRRGAGADVSVYDDISVLIDDEAKEIDEAQNALAAKHAVDLAAAQSAYNDAVVEADRRYADGLAPLRARAAAAVTLREQVKSLSAAAAAPVPDPTEPPEPSASEESSPPSSPEADEPTPPTADPAFADVIPAEEIDFTTAAPTQPVAVTLATGEIKVVSVEDIMAAADNDIPTADLTPDQAVIRNSDLP